MTHIEGSARSVILSPEQEQAIAAIDEFIADPSRQSFALHGLAGSGKTTVLQYTARKYDCAAICTLTGKAASVIRRRSGLQAQTIHSYFYRLREAKKDEHGRDILRFEATHRERELQQRIVLLDESSMINHEMAADILRTGAKIIACGDPGQLPPVIGTQFFSHPDFTLTEIHRQALESPIIRQAHRVRAGRRYEPDHDDFRVALTATDDDLREADIILCWLKRTRDAYNRKARRIRGYWQPNPQPGEPLVCLKNAPDYGLFNGAIYTLQRPFLQNDTSISLDVDGDLVTVPNVAVEGVSKHPTGDLTSRFDAGYAMTVHKGQGSEWDNVVLIDEHRQAVETRQWLYTGITRAAKRILVVK
jgi:exodeoxyribonuclease-5